MPTENTTIYNTRHMPITLLKRMKRLAKQHKGHTVETILTQALKLGLDRIEGKVGNGGRPREN